VCICVGCGWACGGFAGASASSAPVAGGTGWSVSAGTVAGSSGGGVGKFLADMVKVKIKVREDMDSRFVVEAHVTDRSVRHTHQPHRLHTTMEDFDEEIESILYMCREVSGSLPNLVLL